MAGEEREPQVVYSELLGRFHDCDTHGQYDQAQEICLSMLEVAPGKQGEILYLLGQTWWRVGEIDLAEKHFLRTTEFLAPDNPILIRVYNELSFLEQARGAWIGPYGSLIGWIGLLEKRTKMVDNRHLRKALGYSQKSLAVWEKLDFDFKNTPEGQNFWTHALDVQGMAYTATGRFGQAKENHNKIIEGALEIDDKDAAGAAFNNLGLVYYFEAKQHGGERADLLLKGEESFRQSLAQHEGRIYIHVGHAIVLSNLARVLEVEGKTDEARKIYQECLDIAQKTNQELLAKDSAQHLLV